MTAAPTARPRTSPVARTNLVRGWPSGWDLVEAGSATRGDPSASQNFTSLPNDSPQEGQRFMRRLYTRESRRDSQPNPHSRGWALRGARPLEDQGGADICAMCVRYLPALL
jgi:hypothetical protein